LSIEKGLYNMWSELFKIHARVHQVIDHIIPNEAAPSPDLKTTYPNLCHSSFLQFSVIYLYAF